MPAGGGLSQETKINAIGPDIASPKDTRILLSLNLQFKDPILIDFYHISLTKSLIFRACGLKSDTIMIYVAYIGFVPEILLEKLIFGHFSIYAIGRNFFKIIPI